MISGDSGVIIETIEKEKKLSMRKKLFLSKLMSVVWHSKIDTGVRFQRTRKMEEFVRVAREKELERSHTKNWGVRIISLLFTKL